VAAGVKSKNHILVGLLIAGLLGTLVVGKEMWEIEQFNQTILAGGKPETTDYPFETKYAAAYALANQGRYQDATQLFSQLLESQAPQEKVAAVQYNLGNLFMVRGLMVNRNGDTVKDEAEYLLNQARLAYQQSLRLDNRHPDARHNLDRVLSMLPDTPGAEGEQDKLGIVMGNIPTGLP
jgi:mxaK protein